MTITSDQFGLLALLIVLVCGGNSVRQFNLGLKRGMNWFEAEMFSAIDTIKLLITMGIILFLWMHRGT